MATTHDERPLFSVIIPTYSRPRELLRAIDSVMQQTLHDFELIVVDDASPIPPRIPNSSATRGIRPVRLIISKINHGVSAARNTGIGLATGIYTTFLDDDDEYFPSFLANTASTFESAPTDISFTWTNAILRDYSATGFTEIERNFPREYRDDGALLKTVMTTGIGFGIAIRSECFKRAGLFDPTLRVGGDTDLLFRLLTAGYRPALVPGLGVRIHNHKGSRLTSRQNHKRRLATCDLFLERYRGFLSNNPAILRELHAWMAILRKEMAGGPKRA